MSYPLNEVSVKGLRLAHFNQLLGYIEGNAELGIHWGNKKHFDKRDIELREWVKRIIRQKEVEK